MFCWPRFDQSTSCCTNVGRCWRRWLFLMQRRLMRRAPCISSSKDDHYGCSDAVWIADWGNGIEEPSASRFYASIVTPSSLFLAARAT